MTVAEKTVKAAHPDAVCFRTLAQQLRGDGFRVRTLDYGVIGYGETRGKAWANAADGLQGDKPVVPR